MAGKRLTKAQVIAEISDATELDKKSVGRVFDTLSDNIRKQLAGRGAPEGPEGPRSVNEAGVDSVRTVSIT